MQPAQLPLLADATVPKWACSVVENDKVIIPAVIKTYATGINDPVLL
jgi:hypothetical protein